MTTALLDPDDSIRVHRMFSVPDARPKFHLHLPHQCCSTQHVPREHTTKLEIERTTFIDRRTRWRKFRLPGEAAKEGVATDS